MENFLCFDENAFEITVCNVILGLIGWFFR